MKPYLFLASTLALLIGAFFLVYNFSTTRAQDILAQQEAGKAVLLDIRTAEAYTKGHIVGSQSMPLEELDNSSLPSDKTQTIYVHCRLGNKSKLAKEALEAKGYTNVIDLGSMENMRDLGFSFQGEE